MKSPIGSPLLTFSFFVALFFLIGSGTLTAMSTSLQLKGRLQTEEVLKQKHSPFFFPLLSEFFLWKAKMGRTPFFLKLHKAPAQNPLCHHSFFLFD